MVKDLQKVVEQDPLAQLDEQDKELVWKMRYVQHLIRVQTCMYTTLFLCSFTGMYVNSSSLSLCLNYYSQSTGITGLK